MKKYIYMIMGNVSMLLIYIQCFNVLVYLSDFARLTWFFLSFSDSSMRRFKLFFFEITGGWVIPKLVIDTFFLFSSSWLASFMTFAASLMFFTSFESTASCIQSSFGKFLMDFQFFADSQHFIVWMALRDSMFNLFVVSSMTLPIILKLLSTTWHEKHDKSAKTILHIFGYLSNLCTSIHHLSILFASPLTSKAEGNLSSTL